MPPCSRFANRRQRVFSRRGVLGGGAALTAAALAFGSTEPAATHDGPHQFASAEQTQLDAIVNDFLRESGTPGAIVGLWFPERGTWVKTYGINDLETGVPPELGNRFRIGSNTKTFVATLLLQLVDDGLIALDTPLSTFDLDFPKSATATLVQLLGMTSGIFDYTEADGFMAGYIADPMMAFTPEDALAIARAHDPYFAPGERFDYSNTNYVLAGKIAEQLAGAPLEQLISDRILTPQLLSATSFPTDPAMPDPFMAGYTPTSANEPVNEATESNPAIAWASGAMISNLNDMAVWAQVLVDGTLLAPATQAARLQTIPLNEDGSAGYGLGIMQLAGFYGHIGSIPGYSSVALRDPQDGATIVVATNLAGEQDGGADAVALQILAFLLPERFIVPGSPVATPGATPVSS